MLSIEHTAKPAKKSSRRMVSGRPWGNKDGARLADRKTERERKKGESTQHTVTKFCLCRRDGRASAANCRNAFRGDSLSRALIKEMTV